MKIAVIGAGIAGNVAAYHLSRDHAVTVFEANQYLGGHSHTHDIDIGGQSLQVDTGFIVFNDRTYPNFIALLRELGVCWQPADMSFSVHCERSGFEYAGTNLNTLFAQRINLLRPSFYFFLRDILRFNREAQALLDRPDNSISLADFLRDCGFGQRFIDQYILPMGAAIWSMNTEQMLAFPAVFFLRFFSNHGLLSVNDRPQWYVIKGGSRAYVEKLTARYAQGVHKGTPVTAVRRFADFVEVVCADFRQRFDAVFMACHSDQALALLADPSLAETAVLSAIPYQKNNAILHTDQGLLPRRRRAWSSWNYRLPVKKSDAATVTYHMNRLQSLTSPVELCVTLNSHVDIPEASILKTMSYSHPVFTREGVAAQQRQGEINGQHRTFYCGAYWRYGFHEDGVVSALDALQHFNQWLNVSEQLPVRRVG